MSRFAFNPSHFYHVVHRRLTPRPYATQSPLHPYPFPANPNPTPYQIFHLPPSASRSDIKTRYLELVRLYHPDSAIPRFKVPPDIAHERFQAITTAHDILRGKPPSTMSGMKDFRPPTAAAWRASNTSRPDLHSGGDDRWKDRIILGVVALTIGIFVVQTATTRRTAMAQVLKPRDETPEAKEIRKQHELRNLSAT